MSDPTNEMPPVAPAPSAEVGSDPDPQLVFLEELVEEHATVAGDVIEIDATRGRSTAPLRWTVT